MLIDYLQDLNILKGHVNASYKSIRAMSSRASLPAMHYTLLQSQDITSNGGTYTSSIPGLFFFVVVVAVMKKWRMELWSETVSCAQYI